MPVTPAWFNTGGQSLSKGVNKLGSGLESTALNGSSAPAFRLRPLSVSSTCLMVSAIIIYP